MITITFGWFWGAVFIHVKIHFETFLCTSIFRQYVKLKNGADLALGLGPIHCQGPKGKETFSFLFISLYLLSSSHDTLPFYGGKSSNSNISLLIDTLLLHSFACAAQGLWSHGSLADWFDCRFLGLCSVVICCLGLWQSTKCTHFH